MRILHIDKLLHASDAAGGGVGRYVRTLSEASLRRGHTTDEFGCASPDSPAGRPAYVDFNETSGVRRFGKLLHNPSAAVLLQKHLQNHPADVAHLHNIYHHVTASILPVLAGAGVRVVMTLHDYRQLGFEKLFWRWDMGDPNHGPHDEFLRQARRRCAGVSGLALQLRGLIERTTHWYARRVSAFLCPTHFMCEAAGRAGLPRRKIVYSPIPLPPQSAPLPASDDGRTILFAGRLCVEKSPDLLLAVAKRLAGTRFVLAGDGPMRSELLERCRREGLANVELPGQVSREEMAKLYAQASAVVVTSRCMENSPLAMLEAMSAGCCVIAPDQPPLREWIVDGQTGRLYPTGDGEKLTRVVQDVLSNPQPRRDMDRCAQSGVLQRHDVTATMDIIQRAYEGAK